MSEVVMPRLSDSMEEGTIIRWLKADGDEVKRGEELVEIETDKATMAYEADFAGTLSILVEEGTSVAVGTVIGEIADGTAPKQSSALALTVADIAATPPVSSAASLVGASAPASGTETSKANGSNVSRGLRASPLARRVALKLGVELADLSGSGPRGRILKSDVVAGADGISSVAAPSAPTPTPALERTPSPASSQTQSLSRTQALIARRMVKSRTEVPEFALEVDVDMHAALHLRQEMKGSVDPLPSLNDLIVMASARALRQHPRVNASFSDDGFVLHERINVAVAVATDESLVVPVVRNADQLTLGAIAVESRRLIERVREGTVAPPELEGGTFTVSNLGMFGIDRFEGIINAPQSAILCVGAIRERPVAREGQSIVRPMATLTLACDHRILYGAEAARFLADLRTLLETPLLMLL